MTAAEEVTDLLQRLIALHARVEGTAEGLQIVAPGRVVAALSAVMEIDEVLVARMASGGRTQSASASTVLLSVRRSGTASTANCAREIAPILVTASMCARKPGASMPATLLRELIGSTLPTPL